MEKENEGGGLRGGGKGEVALPGAPVAPLRELLPAAPVQQQQAPTAAAQPAAKKPRAKAAAGGAGRKRKQVR